VVDATADTEVVVVTDAVTVASGVSASFVRAFGAIRSNVVETTVAPESPVVGGT
tara:strand:- start:8 stop:169 length:162 start_codon:yes stop_codon:yes gene_type:complete